MTAADKIREALTRMVFLRKDMERLVEEIKAQGYRTEDQSAEAEMLAGMAEEIQQEVNRLTAAEAVVTTVYACRSCGQPVHREMGMWRHTDPQDFEKCGKAGIPRGQGTV